jgi:hypothetical protein
MDVSGNLVLIIQLGQIPRGIWNAHVLVVLKQALSGVSRQILQAQECE